MCKFKIKRCQHLYKTILLPHQTFITTQREIKIKGSYCLSKVNKKIIQRSIKICGTKLWNKLPTRLLNYNSKGLTAFCKKITIALLETFEEK